MIDLGADDLDGALFIAARFGHLEVVKIFVDSGADVNAKLGGDGASILMGAVPNVMKLPNENIDVIGFLFEHGANPCVRDRRGETILDDAQRMNESARVIRLIENHCRKHNCLSPKS